MKQEDFLREKDLFLKNFYFEDYLGRPVLDINSLIELFDQDFIKLHENDMQSHFSFCKGQYNNEIECVQCETHIMNPRNLVRYFGLNLHKGCFKDYYPLVKKELADDERKYFDRVHSLIILGKREKLF